MRHTRSAPLALVALLLAPLPLLAQESPATPDTAASPAARPAVSPGGAFLRSLLVPGWGQASVGSYTRGGVYFTAQTGSWFMLLKTMAKIGEARSVERLRVEHARRALLAAAQEDTILQRRFEFPDSLAAAIAADPAVQHTRNLIDSRKRQREDWIAWTVFWTLASGVDALVGAHFADFPAQVSAEPMRRGGMLIRVSVPAGSPR